MGKGYRLFLDGVSFAYKRNTFDQESSPKGRIGEPHAKVLVMDVQQKERSEEVREIKLVKLMVAISLGKGFVLDCKLFYKISGDYLKGYISCKFPTSFQTAHKFPSKLWIQDGCPCQDRNGAKMAIVQ